ncbi:MAG: DUF2703 domain-containing protein [Ignavibacteria bacterium GWB2_35_12]|nr:MAG: DUF2703 domain-containing protein [Ignavibacteria bacterium GWA2_35_8]OGU39289.1 MAG: DUF2703 domain-containing protein [Ignavibacteria bacterium GWB2_35_12]OGU95930.1 MAG: DUF2703 domain-containing protein [Ignavibacteria bacterium RIFOXYA2_FULL_35_10]OGV21171.1 MAG: DUF2703 domain-containing protein [Ignavibacteria bacterium RIFOXYC2_FULL_35_21]
MNKVDLIFQYFDGCPHAGTLRQNVKEAISGFEGIIDYKEELIDTQELAIKNKFRGSPTLLINGEDLENMPSPEHPALACRYYPNGIPSKEKIIERIKQL